MHKASETNWTLNCTITITKTADSDTVKNAVNSALNTFFANLKTSLGQSLVKSAVITTICNVSGVYDVDETTIPDGITGDNTKFINAQIGTINYKRAE